MKVSISLWNFVEDITIDTVPENCVNLDAAKMKFKYLSNLISQCIFDGLGSGVTLETELGTIRIPTSFLENTIARLTIIEDWDDKDDSDTEEHSSIQG